MKQSIALSAIVLIICLMSIGCDQANGPMEKSGQRADEIIDNIKEGDPALKKKGIGEKAGEEVDETIDNITK